MCCMRNFLTCAICYTFHLHFSLYAKVFLDILCKNMSSSQSFHMFSYLFLLACLSFSVIRYKVISASWFVPGIFWEITEYTLLWIIPYSFTWFCLIKNYWCSASCGSGTVLGNKKETVFLPSWSLYSSVEG